MATDSTGKIIQMSYLKQWSQVLKTYAPTGWAVLSFILPLVAIPLAVEGVKYVAKEVKKRKR